jgi:hypothetical protein
LIFRRSADRQPSAGCGLARSLAFARQKINLLDGVLGGFAQHFTQAPNPLRQWRMSREQIIEEALAIVTGAFQRT